MRYRLLALDLDGTLLDPYGALTASVRAAVRSAAERGLHVLLCTGRRFRTARPLALELGLDGAIVVNNGVLVKDIDSGATLEDAFLPAAVRPEVVERIRELGTPMLYVDAEDEIDIYTEPEQRSHPFQRAYLDDARDHCVFVDDVCRVMRDDVIMISTMGDEGSLSALRARAREQLGDRVRTNQIQNKNYEGAILEFLAPGTSKWAGLSRVARELGVRRHEIVAVGDDTNDVEMIRNAGLGIAMGNAVRAAKSAADLVVRSNAEGGAVEAIETAILKA